MTNLRKQRRDIIRRAYAANPIHKRLYWVRNRLGLKGSDISRDTGIPRTNYFEMENGARTCYYEEFLILGIYFQDKWSTKYDYNKMYPYFQGVKIEKITPMWLFFGQDTSLDSAKEMLEEIKKDFTIRELEMLERQHLLENQIEMFKEKE